MPRMPGSGGAENTESSPIGRKRRRLRGMPIRESAPSTRGLERFCTRSAAPGGEQSPPAVVNGAVYATCGPNAVCAYGLPANRPR